MATTTRRPASWTKLTLLFLTISCCKILCMPSYRSTDFDVHRNWLAITRHLPIQEWYYDDVNGTTVHTLDYPPSFAYWEYLLSNNPLTQYLLDQQMLDQRCLELLPDSHNTPSKACVVFHRSTVILSDAILWWGAWIASAAMSTQHSITLGSFPASFLLIVFHPGLFWLDHIHFQYNGMLFGIFLASLGYLLTANHNNAITDRDFHACHWKAAVLFALLLTMKHLFLTLAPFYFVYLLRRYCLDGPKRNIPLRLYPMQLVTLGAYTLITLLVPFLPFLKQLPQLLDRLFPFGRGLVHEYWAANAWALYSLTEKVVGKGTLPKVSASTCAVALLLSLLPGLYFGAWKAAGQRDNHRLLVAVVYSALSSFQLGFHVHEKAILNAIIPMVLLVVGSSTTKTKPLASYRILFLQMTAFGLLGIFPLLFRAIELPLKLFSYLAYMTICYHALVDQDNTVRQEMSRPMLELVPMAAIVLGILVVLEFVPVKFFGRLEFLPLLLTSVGCAVGLVYTWIRLLVLMVVQ